MIEVEPYADTASWQKLFSVANAGFHAFSAVNIEFLTVAFVGIMDQPV